MSGSVAARLLTAGVGAWLAVCCPPALALSSPDAEDTVVSSTPTLHWHVDQGDDLVAPAVSVYGPGADPNADTPVDTMPVAEDPGDYEWTPNLGPGAFGRYTFVVDDDGGATPVVRHFTLAPLLQVVAQTGDKGRTTLQIFSGFITSVTTSRDGRQPRTAALEGDPVSPKLLVRSVVYPWDCHAGSHTVSVRGTGPMGESETRTATFTTPSCKGRFVVVAPRSVRAGAAAVLQARDDWQQSVRYTLCWGHRGGHLRCVRHKTNAAGKSTVRIRTGRPGKYTASWRFPGRTKARTTVVVR